MEKRNHPFWIEPDYDRFEASGLVCVLSRGPLKSWCGYVGIPENHPWYGLHYGDSVTPPKWMLNRNTSIDDIGIMNLICSTHDPEKNIYSIDIILHVHGGITWSDDHIPTEKISPFWWFGFDCCHAGDLSPKDIFTESEFDFQREGEYRDYKYAKEQCEKLAEQLNRLMTEDE